MWHPDGRRFLFFVQNGDRDKRGLYLGTLDSPERTRLVATDGTGEFRSGNEIFYVRDGTLYLQSFDEGKNAVTGIATSVASPVPTAVSRSAFSTSRAGPVAYRSGRMEEAQLWWFSRNGERLEAFGPPDTEGLAGPVLSPSGQRVAVTRRVGGNSDIWISERGGGAATRLTADPAQEVFPVWRPDESALAFRSSRGQTLDIYLTRVDAEGTATLLLSGAALGIGQISPTDISHDGRWLLFYSTPQGASRDIWAYAMSEPGTTPRKLVATPADESSAHFSPDGRWIAYQTNESGRFEIAVRGFPSGARVWQVSTSGGVHPRWSRDGKELFYVAPDGPLTAVQVSTAGLQFRTTAAASLFAPRFTQTAAANPFNANYDVGSDGRFLINIAVDDLATSPITLILNWKGRN